MAFEYLFEIVAIPADGIFDHEVHFGVGYEVEFDLGLFEGHGPGEGRKGQVIETVETRVSGGRLVGSAQRRRRGGGHRTLDSGRGILVTFGYRKISMCLECADSLERRVARRLTYCKNFRWGGNSVWSNFDLSVM